MHFDLRPPRHLVAFPRRGQQRAPARPRRTPARAAAGSCRGPAPARCTHQISAGSRVGQAGEASPAKKLTCTNFTPASTRPLSRGADPGRIGTKPRAWEYSSQVRFHTGFTASALITTGFRLSGTITLKTPRRTPTPPRSPRSPPPPSGRTSSRRTVPGEHRGEHQRPQQPPPALIRDHPQVPEIDLQLRARLPVIHPHRHPAAAGPHHSAANRCSVRSATPALPRQQDHRSSPPARRPSPTRGSAPARATSSAQPWPCPSGRAGRTTTPPARAAPRSAAPRRHHGPVPPPPRP